MNSFAQTLTSPAGSYVIAIPAIILVAMLLLGIASAISHAQRPQTIRKHTGRGTYWTIQPEVLSRPEGVLTAEHQPKHYAPDDIDDDATVIISGTLETWESVGRRSADSPVRHQPVPPHWVPPIGNVRIAILETMTAEYLFVRQPKDQLQPRMVRPYMASNLV